MEAYISERLYRYMDYGLNGKHQQAVFPCTASSLAVTADTLYCTLQVLVPPLRELEAYIFERLYRYLWTKALMESANREPASQANFSPHILSPTHKASQHEDAISRWLDALQVSHSQIGNLAAYT